MPITDPPFCPNCGSNHWGCTGMDNRPMSSTAHQFGARAYTPVTEELLDDAEDIGGFVMDHWMKDVRGRAAASAVAERKQENRLLVRTATISCVTALITNLAYLYITGRLWFQQG